LLVMKGGAAGPDLNHQPHDGIAMNAGHPLSRADRITLNQATDDLSPAGEWRAVYWPRLLLISEIVDTNGPQVNNNY
jgi:hypothetical protein